MTSSTSARAALAAAAAIGLVAALAAPGAAAPGGDQAVRSAPNEYGSRFYDNAVTVEMPDHVAFAGAGLAEYVDVYCPDRMSEPATAFGTRRVKADGPLYADGTTERYWVSGTRVPVEVYAYEDGDAYDFLKDVCDGVVEPVLVASGTGVAWVRGTTTYVDDGDGTYGDTREENGVRASLRSADGARIHVTGYADVSFHLVDPGTPSEHPEFFGPPSVVTLDVRGLD